MHIYALLKKKVHRVGFEPTSVSTSHPKCDTFTARSSVLALLLYKQFKLTKVFIFVFLPLFVNQNLKGLDKKGFKRF